MSQTVATFASNLPANGPLIEKGISVTPGLTYDVKVDIVVSDLDAADEYVDITINSVNVGRCTPNGVAGSCSDHTCTISPNQFSPSSSSLSVSLQYSSSVQSSVATCPINGVNYGAVAKITLTSVGWLILIFTLALNFAGNIIHMTIL